ncbi:MAG: hypothetical protein K2Z81_03430 [Cyanobacteria bacterium]|nr:hypothetical protein [Cyanobacteriota bacterium]
MSVKRTKKRKSKIAPPPPTATPKAGRLKTARQMERETKEEMINLFLLVGILAGTVGIFWTMLSLLTDPRDQGFGWVATLLAFLYFKLAREKYIDMSRPVATYGAEMLRLLILSVVLFFIFRFAMPKFVDPNQFLLPLLIMGIVSIIVSVFVRKKNSKKSGK